MATVPVLKNHDGVDPERLGPSLVRPKQNEDKVGTEEYDGDAPDYVAPEPPIEDYPLAMPREAMYGWLSNKAKTLQMPLGWSYTALMVAYCATGINLMGSAYGSARATLYGTLLGPPGDGKSKTVERAIASLMIPGDTFRYSTPGSDRGLVRIFSNAKKDEPMELKPYVLVQDELRTLMSKASIQGSSLPSMLCTLWSQDEVGSADKSGHHTANIMLSIIGCLPIKDPSDFSDIYGVASQGGLYDRTLFAPGPTTTWKIDMRWRPEEETFRAPVNVRVPSWAWDALDNWRDGGTIEQPRRRLGELAMRVAIITAAANQDREVTREGLGAAFRFMEWQEKVRDVYNPGHAENPDAKLTSLILDAIKAKGVDETGTPRWLKVSILARDGNWHRKFGAPMLSRVLASLRANDGPLMAKYREKPSYDGKSMIPDYSRPTGEYRLKGELDED